MRVPPRTVRSPLNSSILTGALCACGVLAGCGGGSVAIKPVERLDEQSALTVAVLQNPIALLATGTQVFGKQVSMAYVGPVEWNRMGTISYSLWLELAPTDDQHFRDVTEPQTVTFLLDDGPLVLAPGVAPKVGREPYQPLASWGQTVYFKMTLDDLKRLAATRELRVRIRRIGGVDVDFEPNGETQSALTEYLKGRLATWE